MSRVLLANGTLVIPESGVVDGDLLVEGEVIAGIFERGQAPEADETVDLSGKVVMPGLIEPHSHLGYGAPEDYFTETRAAALGGVTTMMSFNWSRELYHDWLEREVSAAERQAVVDFAFHMGLMTKEQVETLGDYFSRWGVSSYKFYMQYMGSGGANKGLDMNEGFMYQAFEQLARYPGGVMCIHAELPGVVKPYQASVRDSGRDSLDAWTQARPPIAESLALTMALRVTEMTGCPLYVVHLSSKMGLEELRGYQGKTPVYVETCPHYLTHTQDDSMGSLVKVGPPVRTDEDREALWDAIVDGTIDVIGSDHISRTKAEKTGSIWKVPGGFQGSGTTLPVLLSEGYHRRNISLRRIAEVTSYNAAKIFQLYPRKGTIRIGSDADLVVVDLNREETVQATRSHSRSDYSIYEGRWFKGWPVMTMSRGRWVHLDGRPVDGVEGWGNYVHRQPSAASV